MKRVRFRTVFETSLKVFLLSLERVEAACFIDVLATSLEVILDITFVLKHPVSSTVVTIPEQFLCRDSFLMIEL